MKWISATVFVAISLCCLAGLLFLSGCASGDGRYPASYEDNDDGSRAHPAAYLVDRFQVHHQDVQKQKGPNAPFYFKSCSPAGERYFYSRTSYDCYYPF
jgi:hypothetical protein